MVNNAELCIVHSEDLRATVLKKLVFLFKVGEIGQLMYLNYVNATILMIGEGLWTELNPKTLNPSNLPTHIYRLSNNEQTFLDTQTLIGQKNQSEQ